MDGHKNIDNQGMLTKGDNMQNQKVPILEGVCYRNRGRQMCVKAQWGLDGYGRFGYYCCAYPYKPARLTKNGCYLSSLGSEETSQFKKKKVVNSIKASKRAMKGS